MHRSQPSTSTTDLAVAPSRVRPSTSEAPPLDLLDLSGRSSAPPRPTPSAVD
jgi:hypothetical protein